MSGVEWTDAEWLAVREAVVRRPHSGAGDVATAALDALAPHLEARVRQAKAEALREAAGAKTPWDGRTRQAKEFAAWLRERAAREAESCEHPNHGAADHDCRPFRAAPRTTDDQEAPDA